MRHGKKIKKIGRGASHRQATLAAMSTALIRNKRITTTYAKAKALRGYVEPLINRAKSDTLHNRRQVFRRLQDKDAVTVLFGDVAEKVGDRAGGYTRVIKLGRRQGDGAEVAMIELVDYNDIKPDGSGGGRRRKTRRGRRSRKKTTAPVKAAAAAATAEATEAAAAEEATEATAAEDGVEADAAESEGTETADVPTEAGVEAEVKAEAEVEEVVETEESAEEAPEAAAEQDQPANTEGEVEAKGESAVEGESGEEDEDTKRD